MMAWLIKTLLALIEPIGLVWLLLTAAVLVQLRARQWKAGALVGAAWLVLSLGACTGLGSVLLGSLERPWLAVDRAALPRCDALLVLGGGMAVGSGRAVGVDFLEESDRMITGIELIRQGKAAVLVVSGGRSRAPHGEASEAEAARQWIARWHLVDVPVESLGICADTHDEALKMKALATSKGWQRVMLVTSASHLTRAVATFRKAGLEVVPVPGAYQTGIAEGLDPVFDLHEPKPGGFMSYSYWFHEVVGKWVYRWRGWL